MNLLQIIFQFILLSWLGYLTYLIYVKSKSAKLISSASPHPPSISKVKLYRFNPFSDTGGDQSFVLCLLDNDLSGAIITSLHTRDSTRIYAKTIIRGESDGATLSKEEAKVLSMAVKN